LIYAVKLDHLVVVVQHVMAVAKAVEALIVGPYASRRSALTKNFRGPCMFPEYVSTQASTNKA
jgi:hypothetical protein